MKFGLAKMGVAEAFRKCLGITRAQWRWSLPSALEPGA